MAFELRARAFWTALLVCAFGLQSASAADLFDEVAAERLPAVSEINAKFAVVGGVFEDFGAGLVEGSLSVPVTFSTGLQVDGVAGFGDNGGIVGGGAHIFRRDPSLGLLGLYGSVTHVDVTGADYTHWTGGLEANAYLGQFSFESIVGFEGGDNVEDGIFTITNLAYYPTDNLRLYGGVRYIQEDLIGAAGFEFQITPATSNHAFGVFGEGRVSDDDAGAWAGVRVYFGPSNTLINRHRQDDPGNPSLDFLFEQTVQPAAAPAVPLPPVLPENNEGPLG